MDFVVAVSGSRGDAQPAVALGTELAGRGHGVRLAVPPDLLDFCSGAGLPTESYGGSTREILSSDVVRTELRSRDPRRRLRAVSEITMRGGHEMQQQLLDLTVGADAVIATSAGQERAHNVAEVRNIPHIPVHYCPVRRNHETSMLAGLGINLPGFVNNASWTVLEQVLWLGTRTSEQALRAELGLAPLRSPYANAIAATGTPEIQAYDAALFSGLGTRWGDRRPLVGFLNLAAAQRDGVGDRPIDGDLDIWLDAGEAPMYVGFGSMLPSNPLSLAQELRNAATESGVRLLVSGGWSGFMSEVAGDDSIRVVGHVDHDTVLPRCRAALHHGGAGSVAAGLRAALPTAVAWFGADQPIWGRAIVNAHLGTAFPIAKVTRTQLVNAFDILGRPEVRAAARHICDRRTTPADAVARAADIVESTAERPRRDRSRQNPI